MLITDLIYNCHFVFESAEEEHEVQTKRKRIRRKKLKNSLQDSNILHGEQVQSGMQETLVQDNLQLQQIEKISKNKRRKMKKKRQKEKMRAAGLLTYPTNYPQRGRLLF